MRSSPSDDATRIKSWLVSGCPGVMPPDRFPQPLEHAPCDQVADLTVGCLHPDRDKQNTDRPEFALPGEQDQCRRNPRRRWQASMRPRRNPRDNAKTPRGHKPSRPQSKAGEKKSAGLTISQCSILLRRMCPRTVTSTTPNGWISCVSVVAYQTDLGLSRRRHDSTAKVHPNSLSEILSYDRDIGLFPLTHACAEMCRKRPQL